MAIDTLTRFWFIFERFAHPTPLNLGCGVTGRDYEDALQIVRDTVFTRGAPRIIQCIEGIDVSTLDPKHVLPNIGDVTRRGVWFPQGYS